MTKRFSTILALLIVSVLLVGFFQWRKDLERFHVGKPGSSRLGPPELYPDAESISGAINPAVSQQNIAETICTPGWSKTVRPPARITNAIKLGMMRERSLTDPSVYELDHLIPLELGGCPDCKENLWLEPYDTQPGAREKDKVENFLHREVCSGTMSLQEAQQAIAADWYKIYLQISSSKPQ